MINALNTFAIWFKEFMLRTLFGSPDQDYRGEPNEANDKLVDKIMNVAAAGAVVVLFIATCML